MKFNFLYLVKTSFIFLSLFVNFQESQGQENTSIPKLTVYVNDFYPYSYIDEEGTLKGEWVDKIKIYMDNSGLDYQIENVPWQRAIRALNTRDNVLISFFDRNEEREDDYFWLLELITTTNHLLARNEPEFIGLTKEQVLSGDGIAICIRLTTNCQVLKDFGFTEDRLWEVSDHSYGALVPLVKRRRVDFFAVDLEKTQEELRTHGFNETDFITLFELNTTTSYLAASKNINPKILDKLQLSLK